MIPFFPLDNKAVKLKYFSLTLTLTLALIIDTGNGRGDSSPEVNDGGGNKDHGKLPANGCLRKVFNVATILEENLGYAGHDSWPVTPDYGNSNPVTHANPRSKAC